MFNSTEIKDFRDMKSNSKYNVDYRRDRSRSRDRESNHEYNQGYHPDANKRDYDQYNKPDHQENDSRKSSSSSSSSSSSLVEQPIDENLDNLQDDPRVIDGKKIVANPNRRGGRNTESFDPRSTLIRPAARIICGPNRPVYGKELKHDDVVIVPNFLCDEDDWGLYYQLVKEMREAQQAESKGAEWISWAEGAHLISKNPTGSNTYDAIQEKIRKYFEIENKSVGTRFNWYRDSSDWKPFHHDSTYSSFSRFVYVRIYRASCHFSSFSLCLFRSLNIFSTTQLTHTYYYTITKKHLITYRCCI
jgi:hypothetical protein